jgi:cyclin K
VARVCHAKANGIDPSQIPNENKVHCFPNRAIHDLTSVFTLKDVEQVQTNILLVEEALLEAICFDFTVESPHAYLIDTFDNQGPSHRLHQEYAWSLANDS